MGGCWSFELTLAIPVPPGYAGEEPPEGYDFIPLEECIVAVEIKNQRMIKPSDFSLNYDPWNERVFT